MADPFTTAMIIGLASGATKMGGSVLSKLLDSDWHADPTQVNEAIAQSPVRDPYGSEADSAAGRIEGINNPHIFGALGDQEAMAAMQQSYLDDLLAVAQGDKSYAQEQANRDMAHQKSGLLGESNSTRDRFAMGSMRSQAKQLHDATQQNMAAPTAALKAQEQKQGRDMYDAALSQAWNQENSAWDAWRKQRELDEAKRREAEGAKAGILNLGHFDKMHDISQGLMWPRVDATENG